MPKFCSAYSCFNRSDKVECQNISFHRFPLNDSNLLNQWLVKLERKNFVPNKHSVLCSEHFFEEDFEKICPPNKKRILKQGAVPSKFSFSKSGKRKKTSHQFNSALSNQSNVLIIHLAQKTPPTLDSSNETDENSNSSSKNFSCNTCKRKFHYENLLKTHVCMKNPICIENPFYIGNTVSIKKKRHFCNWCKKEFTDEEALNLHCKHCQYRTVQSKYACEFCNKSVANRSALLCHYRVKHTGERPYVCDVCGKAFAMRSYLNLHYRYHTGDKLYKCEFCIKVFADLNSYKKHYICHTSEKQNKQKFSGKKVTKNI